MTQATDSTQGVTAIAPNLTFKFSDGRSIQMSRLGLGHVIKAGETIAQLWPSIQTAASGSGALEEDEATEMKGLALIQALIGSNQDVLEVIAPIFKLSAQEMLDEEKVQLADVPLMVEALIAHPDMAAFVKNFQGLMKSPAWTEMQTRLKGNTKAPKIGKSN
jgi:hypothetical protein